MLVPPYRLQGHGDHFYTTSEEERDNAVSQYGYQIEGIACYVSPDDGKVVPDLSAIRDLIAATALAAIITCNMSGETTRKRNVQTAALRAYEYADAMLAVR